MAAAAEAETEAVAASLFLAARRVAASRREWRGGCVRAIAPFQGYSAARDLFGTAFGISLCLAVFVFVSVRRWHAKS